MERVGAKRRSWSERERSDERASELASKEVSGTREGERGNGPE